MAILPLFIFTISAVASLAPFVSAEQQQQPLVAGPTTVPAFPVIQSSTPNKTCHLDLSNELFGGVTAACASGVLDRSRCCPVLAAWLFAAHSRAALQLSSSSSDGDDGFSSIAPLRPDDAQRCADALQASLKKRDVQLARPNASCDTMICFCGIRLHEIGSLSCPAAFEVNSTVSTATRIGAVAGDRNATPTAAVRRLEEDCRNASYAGCTRCLRSLDKLKGKIVGGGGVGGGDDGGDRASKMFGRDCQLMGLTWLLARNKKLYIPTVSAVLRAMLYSAHPPSPSQQQQQYRCSPDQENMPLAVDSLQFQKPTSSAATAAVISAAAPASFLTFVLLLLLVLS